MSVSHTIVNVSVSHKIVIYRVFLRGLDRGGHTMDCNCPTWCLANNMLSNNYQTQLQRGITKIISILWLTDISCMTYRHLQNLFKLTIFLPKSVWTCIWFCLISVSVYQCISVSVYFYAQIFPFGEKKCHDMYFCSYFDFSFALRSCGRKNVCKSRKWKWNI